MSTSRSKTSLVIRLSLALGVLLLLAACNQDTLTTPIPHSSDTDEAPLFTSNDLTNAIQVTELSNITIEGLELNNETEAVELPYVEEEQGDLATQAVLPGVKGWLVVYRVNTAGTYQIRLYDQTDDSNTKTVYSGTDAVQSVAVNGSGTLVAASILDDSTANHDIYLFDLTTMTSFNLTGTASRNEIDVSMTHNGTKIAYGRENSDGKLRPFICDYDANNQSCNVTNLSNFRDQIQPSLSANGNYLALVKLLPNDRYQVRLYDFNTNTYTDVRSNNDILEHPSVDDSGTQVLYRRQRDTSGTDSIRIKDLVANTVRSELNDSVALDHPHITSPGEYFVYGVFSPSSSTRKARTRNFQTNTFATPQGGAWNYYQPFWMWESGGCTNPVYIPDTNLEQAVRNRLVKPSGELTCEDMASLLSLNAAGTGVSDLGGLQHAINLQYLNLYNNTVSDINNLSGLTSLEYLNLANNTLSNISSLSGLTSLQDLSLSGNDISDISSLAGPTNLQYLHLANNDIGDISSLAGLTSLEYLSLRNNFITDIQALVDNTGLGSGDDLFFEDNCLDLNSAPDSTNVSILQARGIRYFGYSPQKSSGCP